MKRHSIKFVKRDINFNEINIDNVECTGKNFFWCCMTLLFGICSIIVIVLLAKEMLHNIQGIFAYFFISLIFVVPFIYCLLKIKNYCFSTKNNKILYRNILGTTYKNEIDRIKDIKWIKMSNRLEIFIIKMENKKTIIVSNYLTNFDLLKLKFKKEGKL